MDILAHAIWGAFGAKGINKKLVEKNKSKVGVWAFAFWSIAPDLLAFLIPFGWIGVLVYQGISIPEDSSIYSSLYKHPLELSEVLYSYSHSLIVFIFLFILISVIKKHYYWPIFGFALHIVIDMFTHTSYTYPAKIFFPLSDFSVRGFISWMHPYFMIANYVLIIITFFYFLLIKKKNAHTV